MDEGHYEYLGDHILHVYVPSHYPLRLKLMVMAALKTYEIGNKSMDHMLKKYGDVWAEQFDVDCSNCGRTVRFRSSLNLHEEDFILECYRCGKFFCKNCLDWEHPIADEKGKAHKVYCLKCSQKRRKKDTPKTEELKKKKGALRVIRLDDRKKRK